MAVIVARRKLTEGVRNLVLFIGSLVMLFPVFWLLTCAVKTNAEITAIPLKLFPERIRWENFPNMFNRINMARYYLNSIIFAGISTITVVFSGSLAGYIFAKYRFKGKEVVFLVVLSVMMLPFPVLLVPLYVIMANLGWVDTFAGLIAPGAVTAFGIFLMRQFIASIPTDLILSMRIDGSSEVGIWTRLILPNTKPALASLSIFCFMANWDNFLWPLVISTTEKTRPLTVGLAMFVDEWWIEYNLMMAGSVIAVLPVLIVFFIAQQQLIEGITLSGLKS
jgi:multiple sugar transport system permease protein